MKNFISLLLIFSSSYILAQQNPIFKNIAVDFLYGKNIAHDKSLKDAIEGNPYGILLTFDTPNYKASNFNKLYNYPNKGFSAIYLNYNSTVLGESFGLYRHYQYNLTPHRKINLQLSTAFGLGYANHPYRATTNNKNFALGSHLLVTAYLKLNYFSYLLNQNLKFNTGFMLVHFSNIAFKNPNLGINSLFLNAGIKYSLNNKQKIVEPSTIANIIKTWHYQFLIRGGTNESLIIGSGLHPFYTLSTYAGKTLNNFSTLTFGIDWFHSKFLKAYILNQELENNTNYNEKDFNRFGIFIGHELTQNGFAFVSQVGYYLYYPFPYVSRVYERFGFKYKLTKHIFSEITLKANLFRAEALEIGLGYAIN